MEQIVKCPRCKKETVYSTSNIYRPFCSERCQLIDFGAWAEEKYAVPVEGSDDMDLVPDQEDEDNGAV